MTSLSFTRTGKRHPTRRLIQTIGIMLALITMLILPQTATYAQSGNSTTAPDTAGDIGWHTSLVLDGNGHPVVSYMDSANGDLKLMHCNDPNCDANVNGPESITSPDTNGQVGLYTSLVLDSNGNPVVSYHDEGNGTLKVMHCNDPNCAGGDESIIDAVTTPNTGWSTSLALDSNSNPVISYYDQMDGDLRLLHCTDPDCSYFAPFTVPDEVGDVGWDSSLVLDSSDNPVIAYYDGTNGDLKVMHCNDPNCDANVSGPESITSPDTNGDVGLWSSLALDNNGNPVVAYSGNGALKVMHCNDPNCAGGDESISSLQNIGGGDETSLVLDSSGNPVIAFTDYTNGDLKVLHCNDPNCAGGNESITTPDSNGHVGQYPSLVLDSSGNPVVSYYDQTNGDLRLLHCNDPNCTNSIPVATDDSYITDGITPLSVAAPGLLSNDNDADNNPLTAIVVSQPTSGILILNANGAFTYTHGVNFSGSDSFTYQVNDGSNDSNVATVTINTVNSPPVANNDVYSINEDTTLTIAAPGLLGNDSDTDGNPLTATVSSQPANGTAAVNADGSFSYTPNGNYTGSDSFTYKANDGLVDSSDATVTLTINPVNDAPVATNDSYNTYEGKPLAIAASGLLSNDHDIDGDPLTASLANQPINGVVTINADGSFTYTPNPSFSGSDSFTYKANDGSADSNVATVSITVTAMPTPVGYWAFDEGGCTALVDGSGHGLNGAFFCPWSSDTPSGTGYALQFDGVNDMVTVADHSILDLNQHTISLWIKPTQQKSDWQPLLVKEHSNGFQRNYGLFIQPNRMKLHFHANDASCANWIGAVDSVNSLVLNSWNHVAVTFDGSKAGWFRIRFTLLIHR